MNLAAMPPVQPSDGNNGLIDIMRILRGLSSRFLPCGCLAGVYETYDNDIVGVLDARGATCAHPAHQPGQTVGLDAVDSVTGLLDDSSDRHTPSA